MQHLYSHHIYQFLCIHQKNNHNEKTIGETKKTLTIEDVQENGNLPDCCKRFKLCFTQFMICINYKFDEYFPTEMWMLKDCY